MMNNTSLERYFEPFRRNTIGREHVFHFPSGEKEIIYADWTASGRGYGPIESFLQNEVVPFFANSHTHTTATGTLMTTAYEKAKSIIKQHVRAGEDDMLIFCGSGMTSAVNKLQRLLGMRISERCAAYLPGNQLPQPRDEQRPVVFITSMEHHSNHVSWQETMATVEIIDQTADGLVDVDHFQQLLSKYRSRKHKIAAITACSNVTGIQSPYYEIARLIHGQNGLCFVDFASSAPYVDINMHPAEEDAHLDAICFSMHKFLGGPGTPGVLIFNSKLYHNTVPDHPGGGTVLYSNPWKARKYVTDIEQREDGGTPPLLQGIKAAMCIRLKEEMGVDNMLRREEELLSIVFDRLSTMKGISILQENVKKRLGIISFMVEGAHYNLVVRLLNDKFGIQARGGCSCAGTYGHKLLHVDQEWSEKIWKSIRSGDLSSKPGWIRISLHPTMTNGEVEFIMDAIEDTVSNFRTWMQEYDYDFASNEYNLKAGMQVEDHRVDEWFRFAHRGNAFQFFGHRRGQLAV